MSSEESTTLKARKSDPPREQAPAPKDEREEASLVNVIGEWADTSTIHGIPHAFNRTHYNRIRRIVWSVLVLGSFGVMIWQLWTLIDEYTKYEVQTNSQLIYPTSLPFP